MKTLLIILTLAWVALFYVVSANAADITPEVICHVKDAIRSKRPNSPTWPDWYCLRVSEAINAAAEKTHQRPDILMSIAVVESDLRSNVAVWHPPTAQATRDPSYHRWYSDVRPGSCGDLGIMGVRCCLGENMLCSNGLVKGWKYPAVLVLENNIMLGAKILAGKPKLNDYNGGKGYAEKVRAVAGALLGVRIKNGHARIRKLVDQILHGLGFERTT